MIARHHAVPFYVAAPFTSIDFSIPSGEHIVIEERPECEMTCIGEQRIAASGECYKPVLRVVGLIIKIVLQVSRCGIRLLT